MQEACHKKGSKKQTKKTTRTSVFISLFLKAELDVANDVKTKRISFCMVRRVENNDKAQLKYKTSNIFGSIFNKGDDSYGGKGKTYNEKKRMEISTTRRRNLRIIKYSDTEVSVSELGKILS